MGLDSAAQVRGALGRRSGLIVPKPMLADVWTGTDGDAWNATLWDVLSGSGTSSVTIFGNEGRMIASGEVHATARARPRIPNMATLDLTVSFTMYDLSGSGVNFESYPGISFRTDGSSGGVPASNGYYVQANTVTGSITLEKVDGGARTELGSAAFTWANATKYRLRISAVGTSLRVKVWAASGAEPSAWNITTTDATWATGSMLFSMVNAGDGASRSVRWDDLAVA